MNAILPAGPAHAAALAAIHGAAFPANETWGADVIALQLGLAGAFGFLHRAGGMVLARVVADEAEILTLAVSPAARRQGIGRALLSAAMAEAARRGAGTMFLEVSVLNHAAVMLYDTAGFTEIGRRRRYYPGGADARTMRAPLMPCRPGAAAER